MTPLGRLLRPRHVAVFGGRWAENVIAQCQRVGFGGPIWPVHPTRDSLGGLPCLPSIDALPQAPDAAFVGVNRHQSVEVVRTLADRGAGGAVCFASGFAEAEDGREAGAALQARLVEAAGVMPILGPNCYGLINYLDGALLWPDQHGGKPVERGVAIVGQSSNVLINLTMQRRGLPLAYVIAAGNQAQTGLTDIAHALVDDPRVTAIGVHIEGPGDLRRLEGLAHAARRARTSVVALKVGRSAAAQAATVSHTASIAGSDSAGRAVLGRLGIAVVDSLPEFLETLKLLHVHGPLAGRRLVSVSCSGGEASLMGDHAEGRRLSFPPFDADRRRAIARTLGPLVTVANPLDYHTFIWGDRPALTATFGAVAEAGADLTLFVLDFPRTDRCDDTGWAPAVEAIAAAGRLAPVGVVASLPETMPEDRAEALMARGIAPLAGLPEGLAAAEAAADIGETWSQAPAAPLLLAGVHPGPFELMEETAARAALSAHGLTFPQAERAANPDAAADIAERLGFPVALKGLGFAHKTEAGAVRLGLSDRDQVRSAAAAMAGASGFLVERQITNTVAELLVGVLRDPAWGFQLTLGAGGVLAELLEDTATLAVPASPGEIRDALNGLRLGPVLAGYRGKSGANCGAIVAAACAVQDFATIEAARLFEVEINPLILTPDDAIAVDVLVRLGAS